MHACAAAKQYIPCRGHLPPTQRCRKETRVVVVVQVGVMLQAVPATNSECVVRAVAAGRMARSGAAGAGRWVLNE
jgi:hypothetical protein